MYPDFDAQKNGGLKAPHLGKQMTEIFIVYEVYLHRELMKRHSCWNISP